MTATYWVYFFLAVSVLSLFVAFLFTRREIGSDIGTPDMQKIAAATAVEKQRAKRLQDFLADGTEPWRPFWACCSPHWLTGRRSRGAEGKPTWCCRICRA